MAQESWKRDKEETGCHAPEGLIMCINNCGFFGSPATMNLCSKCYNEFVLLKAPPGSCGIEKLPEVSIPRPDLDLLAEVRSAPRISDDGSGSSSSCSAAAVGREPQQQPIRQANRCASCRKRVGLTGFKCRCGDMFCSLHRYSDKHGCTFDYKAAGREAIAKANPVVKADKIQRF